MHPKHCVRTLRMQRPIRHIAPTQYVTGLKTEVALFFSTSAALLLGSASLVGVTAQWNIVDAFSNSARPVLSEPSILADAIEVMDPATERWLKFQSLVKQWREERGVRS